MKDTTLIKFWDWFKSISDDLLLDPTRSDLIYQIDNRVNRLGHFDWEIGPWKDNLFYFAISPSLDITRLELTRQIIEYAPKCDGWYFFASKPPKRDWHGIWKMKNEMGREILVDSSNWEYILYEFEDKTFDMDIMIDDIDGDIGIINMAIDIALTGYLGEEKYITAIKNVKIVTSFDEELKKKTTRLQYIKKHIESIL